MIHFITNQTDFLEGLDAKIPIKPASVQDVYDYFRRKPEVEIDTETTGFDPHVDRILTLQLGDYDNQFVVDAKTVNLLQFKPLMDEMDKLLLLQNAKFDLRFFYHLGIRCPKVYDTMLAEAILTTGHKKRELALDALANKYAGASLDKSIRGEIHRGLTDRVIQYAAYDVKYLGKIKQGQMAKLVKYKLADSTDPLNKYTVLGLENRVVRAFAQMEYTGVNIDRERWEATSQEINMELGNQEELLDNIVINEPKLQDFVPKTVQANLFGFKERTLDINYASPQQKVKVLNKLGLNVDSSADKILQKFQDKHPFVKELRALNKLNKLDSSFGMSLLEKAYHPVTGKFHPEYWQILQTGRISVKQPNTNQIPARGKFGPMIRKSFIASKDYKVVGGDYSAMELRELADFSQDPLWLGVFRDGRDLHTVLCAQTFDIDESQARDPFPENPDITYRDIQKTINYGLAYGMSAKKLSETMNSSTYKAQKVIDAFFRKVPEVDKTLKKFGRFAVNNGYIRTAPPYGRIRWFADAEIALMKGDTFRMGEIERAGMNTPIQGTNADITKLAMVNAFEYIEKHNYPANIILSVYDEIQTEAHKDVAEEWSDKLQEIMENAAKIIIDSVPIIAECSVSDYWDH